MRMMVLQKLKWLGLLLFWGWSSIIWGQIKEPSIIDFERLQSYLHRTSDSTYVIHFWATWCSPCVEEMPTIGAVADAYADKKVKILLVSLDMPSMLRSHLIPFLQKYQLYQEAVLLDAPDFDAWIDKVAKEWQGALPATLIYKGAHRRFFPTALSKKEWTQTLDAFLRGTF